MANFGFKSGRGENPARQTGAEILGDGMSKLRSRKDDSFDFSRLSLRDKVWLGFDSALDFPLPGSPANLIHTFADFREAWEANRDYYLDGGYQDPDLPKPYDHFVRYSPGRRPLGYWLFDLGYPQIPENQVKELQNLRMISPEEFEAAKKLAKEFGGDFSPAERETLLEEHRNGI
jgi:hypothetical protein